MSAPAFAQVLPCKLPASRPHGASKEIRFLPYEMPHVHASALRALPAIGFLLKKADAQRIQAHQNTNLALILAMAGGSADRDAGITIALQPATEGGKQGTRVDVRVQSGIVGAVYSNKFATPLLDEMECLAGTLSQADPLEFPKGAATDHPSIEKRSVTIPAGTMVRVVVRNYTVLTGGQKPAVLEVAEDVEVDGARVIQRGALVPGLVEPVSVGSSGYSLYFDRTTAVDGQAVSLTASYAIGGMMPLLLRADAMPASTSRAVGVSNPDRDAAMRQLVMGAPMTPLMLSFYLSQVVQSDLRTRLLQLPLTIRAGTTFHVRTVGALVVELGGKK